jgi:hypothetical protein
VLGWLIWPLRVDTYSPFWMPILGAFLALKARSIYRQARGQGADHDRADTGVAQPSEHAPAPASIPTPAKVN